MTKQRHSSQPRGKVFLVGAGPGDAGLITWRGVQCLRQADAVLYDYLVNPAILRHAPPSAELICLGRHGTGRIWQQPEINARLVELARQSKQVVRLKGGDPAIFGRLAEEIQALQSANVTYEVVPGITAGLAAGSYAGIWLTRRDAASAIALITGHEGDSPDAPQLDYAALAAFPGTLVFYMGVTTAAQWSAALISAGKSPDTPAAIVRRCSWPDQTVVRCTLGTIAEQLAALHMRPPVAFIIGDVVGLSQAESWFARRPLFGRRVLVTRPVDRADVLCEKLSELGAECLLQPAIEVSPPGDWGPVDAALAGIGNFDWLVFSSVNGVEYLLNRLWDTGGDLRRLAGIKLATIGPGTAEELEKYHLRVDVQPADDYRAEALADALTPLARGKRFLLARASRGREVLAERLQAAGADVTQIVVYTSTDVAAAAPEIIEALRSGRIDWVTVTSSAIARSVARMFGDDLRKANIATISPITSTTLREAGFEPAAEAAQYTMQGVVQAILSAEIPPASQ